MLFKDQPKIQKSKVYLIQDIPVDKETGKPKYMY